jgi:predicted phosphoribosyltransferase
MAKVSIEDIQGAFHLAHRLHPCVFVYTDRYANRREAGRELARVLAAFAAKKPVVVALPRGGVPVAYEVARVLGAPLDVLEVRKLGGPRHPEQSVGAVAEGGATVIDARRAAAYGLVPGAFAGAAEKTARLIGARARRYRRGLAPIDVRRRIVIVVDDGIATGSTARAALRALRGRGARMLVFAAPVGDAAALAELAGEADGVVCTRSTGELDSVSAWYEEFAPPSEADVIDLLRRAAAKPARAVGNSP